MSTGCLLYDIPDVLDQPYVSLLKSRRWLIVNTLDEEKLVKILNLMSKAIEENRKILAELQRINCDVPTAELEDITTRLSYLI